jgi:hypothetical protein
MSKSNEFLLLEYPLLSDFRPSRGNNSFETLWTRDERYLMNLQRSKILEKMYDLALGVDKEI